MSLRNRSSKNNDSFDLDSYLEEKSTEGFTQEPPSPPKEKKPSNFFRNATLVIVAALASVLWYYDWNPRAAIAGIFTSSEPDIVMIGTPNGESVIVLPPSTPETPIVINNQRLAELEETAVALANSEEIERLTEQSVALALDAAFAALEGLGNIEIEGLEGLESLEALESLEEFENTEQIGLAIENALSEAFNNLDFSDVSIESGVTNNADFEQFSREMAELDITQFDDESIQSMHVAGVPISFLSQLNQAGLLDRLNANEIIQIFQED